MKTDDVVFIIAIGSIVVPGILMLWSLFFMLIRDIFRGRL